MYGILIVGAGEAGVMAALTLRQQGYQGQITLLGDEHGRPYERPPLSKQSLLDGTDAPLISGSQELEALNIHYRNGQRVVAIHRDQQQVELASGEQLPYERLLLATGAQARTLTIEGMPAEQVLTLRSRADAERIRQRARPGQNVVMIGAGFIGLELAASLRTMGLEVTVLESAERILQRAVPASIASLIAAEHQQHGVQIRCQSSVQYASSTASGYQLHLHNGEPINADWVLAGIGSVPDTRLAQDAGLNVDNGIQVDRCLRTNDPVIFAAGDCARFPLDLYNTDVRLESWRCAREQGEIAALNMLGANSAYNLAPWFWSDQYQLGLQMVGLPIGVTQEVIRDFNGSRLVFLLNARQQLLAACGVGPGNTVARDIKIAERLINQGIHPTAEQLADTSISLKSLLKG